MKKLKFLFDCYLPVEHAHAAVSPLQIFLWIFLTLKFTFNLHVIDKS